MIWDSDRALGLVFLVLRGLGFRASTGDFVKASVISLFVISCCSGGGDCWLPTVQGLGSTAVWELYKDCQAKATFNPM